MRKNEKLTVYFDRYSRRYYSYDEGSLPGDIREEIKFWEDNPETPGVFSEKTYQA